VRNGSPQALLVPLGAVLVAVALAVGLITLGRSHDASGSAQLEGALMPANLVAAPFTLRDQDGIATTLRHERGRVVVLTFLHSRCTGACPIIAQQIRGALDQLGTRARNVTALAISVDPRQDTPANARHFLRVQHMGGRLRFLLGTRRELAPIWKAYGVQPVGARGGHTLLTDLVDRHGVLRVGYTTAAITPEMLAHDLGVLLDQ
jgi:protein SCO1